MNIKSREDSGSLGYYALSTLKTFPKYWRLF